jgi:hypothetical protein
MNRVTILLESVPSQTRCEEIARMKAAEHFGQQNPRWTVVYRLPEDTPMHLADQFLAEIRERRWVKPVFLLIYGSTPVEDS